MCAIESKCLQRSPQGVRAARKGIVDLLPGAEKRSSAARVSDGTLEPDPEDSLHYRLLLGDGDINNRGKGDAGFNTPVCRPRGVQKTAKRGSSPSQHRACAKTDFSYKKARSSIEPVVLLLDVGGDHTGAYRAKVPAVPGSTPIGAADEMQNGMKGNGAPRALGARNSRFDSDLPDCPALSRWHVEETCTRRRAASRQRSFDATRRTTVGSLRSGATCCAKRSLD